MRRAEAVIGALLLLATAGCAGQRKVNSPARRLTLDCVELRSIERWRVVDPYHIIVYTPDRAAAYLVEFSQPCTSTSELPEHIGPAAHQPGSLCADGRDALLVNEQRCVVDTLLRYKTAP